LVNYYKNKKVLITGSSGFVGSWMSTVLHNIGAKVYGISLKANTNPNLFEILQLEKKISQYYININDADKIKNIIRDIQPDIVFNLAAQPLVRESYRIPIETFDTNIIGTLNVLHACSFLKKKVNFISITTDKCYENNEDGKNFNEFDAMGGKDPYSASKACTEIVVKSYALSFNDKNSLDICTARAGNIIGGGDWCKDRIVTDIVSAIVNKKDILLRSPNAIRPWQHVIDVIIGYLRLGVFNAGKDEVFEAFNFGPNKENELNVESLVKKFLANWGDENVSIKIDDNENPPESSTLKLDSAKALNLLNWQPAMTIDETIAFTADWYESYYKKNKDMYQFTVDQISSFI
tara:strand:+ start:10051 stop:11097 length:1047 start_codon:yes stop_codon:yes gene_type:complete